MTDINLASGGAQRESGVDKTNLGIVAMLIILVLLLATYGALLLLKNNMTSQIQVSQQEFDAKYKSLTEGDGKTVVDFQNRIDLAKKSMPMDRDISGDMTQLEKLMVPGAYLDSYKYDDTTKNITLTCIADNYNTVAKQILSFKKAAVFSGVIPGGSVARSAGDSTTGNDNTSKKINFTLILTLK
jgi:hypothetical protein